MSAKQDVVFYCWRCGQKLAVPDTCQGKNVSCPRCQRQLTVPAEEGVQKRDVPPEELAEDALNATESEMTFACEHCGWIIIVDKRGAGMTFPCPGCGSQVVAPPEPGALCLQTDGGAPAEAVSGEAPA